MRQCLLFSLVISSLLSGAAHAENIVFPADAGVINVTRPPYNARGDGKTDDTLALQTALRDAAGNTRKIVYLPNGVYRVRTTLSWPSVLNTYGFVNLQGQSRDKTVIALTDGAFPDAKNPQPVLTGGHHGSADWFANSVRNLTVDTGAHNPGAIGIQFFANNMGSLRDVSIRSGDGQGAIGLDLGYNDMNGPLLVKNLRVHGFDVGVSAAGGVNSQTLEHLSLSNQNVVGLRNTGQCLSIRDLVSDNRVPALENTGPALTTLIGATLRATAKRQAAIVNTAGLYARAVTTTGYAQVLAGQPGTRLAEYASSPPLHLFSVPPHANSILVKETPEVPWGDPKTWVSPTRYGAVPNQDHDDSPAIQAAIDSGAQTVYFPNGTYHVRETVFIRGTVRRLIGCEATIEASEMGGKPAFQMVGSGAPIVVFERLGSGYSKTPTLDNASARTLVVRDCININGAMTGSGDVFLEDVCSNPSTNWRFGHQHVWARQFNVESEDTHIVNAGGMLWILGLKTERGGTLIETTDGGQTQVDGGFCYTTTAGRLAPMFTVSGANSSLAITLGEACFTGDPYTTLIRETRADETRTLLKNKGVPERLNGSLLTRYLSGADARDQRKQVRP